jgi:hypothetical protein
VTLVKELAAHSPLSPGGKVMSYRIVRIDVHKKMLAVVIGDVEVMTSSSLSEGVIPAVQSSCA